MQLTELPPATAAVFPGVWGLGTWPLRLSQHKAGLQTRLRRYQRHCNTLGVPQHASLCAGHSGARLQGPHVSHECQPVQFAIHDPPSSPLPNWCICSDMALLLIDSGYTVHSSRVRKGVTKRPVMQPWTRSWTLTSLSLQLRWPMYLHVLCNPLHPTNYPDSYSHKTKMAPAGLQNPSRALNSTSYMSAVARAPPVFGYRRHLYSTSR